MKIRYSSILVLNLILIIFLNGIVKSQTDSLKARQANIVIKTRTSRDSVVLRWAVSNAGGWFITNKSGFIVEKAKVDTNNKSYPISFKKLNKYPIKPWPLKEWKNKAGKNNRYANIAAQALYGKNFISKSMRNSKNGNFLKAANQLQSRYGFSMFAADNDALTAEGLGLRIMDKNVKLGETYVYRVYPARQDSSYPIDTAYAVVKVTSFRESPAPYDLKLKPGDGSIKLTWKDVKGATYSGYYVYRSDDNLHFKKLNDVPIVLFSSTKSKHVHKYTYVDTLVKNYHKYYYKVKGITPFAELSKPSEIEGIGKDLTPPPSPKVNKPQQINIHTIKLSWKYPKNVPDLKGFIIGKSSNPKNVFTPLVKKTLAKNTRTFTDKSASSNVPFYKVGAVDTAGNIASSLVIYIMLIDSLPPSQPVGLRGSIDTNGVVKLHWKLGPEKNIMGYRVLWANSPKHEFTTEPGKIIRDTAFTDTINIKNLTRYIYYRITAVNNRYNESVPSKILALKKPDKISPAASAFKNVFVTDKSVKLSWAASPSEDVMYQELLRSDNKKLWARIDSFDSRINSYLDTNVVQNKMYEYKLTSVDSDGNKSESSIVQARPYDMGIRPSPKIISAKFDSSNHNVFIKWKYVSPKKERYYFVIYRSKGKNILTTYKAVKSTKNSFYDNMLTGKGVYNYSVKVKVYNGSQSPLSKTIKISIK